jgi:hypothetical protein
MMRILAIGLFWLVLATIGAAPIFESKESATQRARFERRPPAKFPKMDRAGSVFSFPASFDSWARDHFGFRSALISLHAFVHYRILQDLPNTRYIKGKDGWFFRGIGKHRAAVGNEETYNDVLDLAGREPFTTQELDTWEERLKKRRQKVNSRGGLYLFTIGPRKSTIYPELLPEVIALNKGKTRLDQFLEKMIHTIPDIVFDLSPTLFAAKQTNGYSRLYYRTDTHWNYYGAYFAYREFMQRVGGRLSRQDLKPVDLSYFNIVERPGWFHTGFLAETRIKEREGFVALFPKADSPYANVRIMRAAGGFVEAGGDETSGGRQAQLTEVGIGDSDMEIHKVKFLGKPGFGDCRFIRNESSGLPLKDLILIGDSFLQMAAPYFSAHAERTYLCRQTKAMELPVFDVALNSEIKTEVVLQELTESYLGR